jgi:hypothetical protein
MVRHLFPNTEELITKADTGGEVKNDAHTELELAR